MSDQAIPQTHVRTPETDEVLRRVGRNVVVFQQVELLLKVLTARSEIRGPANELAAIIERQAETVHKKTMGALAKALASNVLQAQDEQESPEGRIDETWHGFRFSVDADAEFVDRHGSEMRTLVDTRNDLIHHFLPRWHSAVGGGTEAALDYLDSQWAEAKRMVERLQGWVHSFQTGYKQLAEFLASPEGLRQVELAFLRGSALVMMLGECAIRTARADGWALLSTAGDLIKREAPDELQDLRQRFGLPSLKGVLLATELFDVIDEPTASGNTRTIYRLNERYELQHRQGVSTLSHTGPPV